MSAEAKPITAMRAPSPRRDNPLTRSAAGMVGMAILGVVLLACVATMPWTLGRAAGRGDAAGSPRYDVQYRTARHLPPAWWPPDSRETGDTAASRLEATARAMALERIAHERGVGVEKLAAEGVEPSPEQVRAARPFYLMGTDLLGRDVFVRSLAGGGISLGIGICAALISVVLGTLYGAVSGYIGGRTDAVMMRAVDVLYGLPYVLLVVLLAIAASGVMEEYVSRQKARTKWVREQAVREVSAGTAERGIEPANVRSPKVETADEILKQVPALKARLEREAADKYPARKVSDGGRMAYDLITLLVAIGGVSWLTMARVVRGQVLSLKAQPFVEAARAMGVGVGGIFWRHLLPNLVGVIVVYATLTVPQAILQESFLSFLGIGVRAPLPSWGNMAAEGLAELNPVKSHWWLLLFPCAMLGLTLLALNLVGEGLREAMDPKRSR